MDKITIDFAILTANDLNINQYLTLYNFACPGCISHIYRGKMDDMVILENKGFIKIINKEVVLREKAKDMFQINDEDFFLKWLLAYPIRVQKTSGGSRALSPASDETIEGRNLRAKWKKLFKGNVEGEMKAIHVLEAEVAMRIKAGDLEYMVEASRWLNGGFHEKYEYLLDEKTDVNSQGIVDYQEDWM